MEELAQALIVAKGSQECVVCLQTTNTHLFCLHAIR